MLILAAPVFIQSGIIIVANESTFQLAQSNTPRPFFFTFLPSTACAVRSTKLATSFLRCIYGIFDGSLCCTEGLWPNDKRSFHLPLDAAVNIQMSHHQLMV